ncbi:type IV pilus assembly protein PilZ [Candidatus Magnetoovum chiemensis]|nr:type IV pilus assembly protein PilZ [Candidatus Magnetoovum chiemensis]
MDRRTHERIDLLLPFKARKLDKNEQQNINSTISGTAILVDLKTLHCYNDKTVIQWINTVKERFDSMLEIINKQKTNNEFLHLTFKPINISGGGLRFDTKDEYSSDDIFEFKIMLPIIPPIPIYLYGETIRISTNKDTYTIATKLTAMTSQFRKEICSLLSSLNNKD